VVDGRELDELVKQVKPSYPSWDGGVGTKGAVALRTNVEDT